MFHNHQKTARDRVIVLLERYTGFTLFVLSVYSTMFPIGLCNPLAAIFCFVNSAIQVRTLKLHLLRHIIQKVKSMI